VPVGRTVKRSITIDEDLDRQLSERFGSGGKSRFLNDVAREELARLDMAGLLDRMDEEDGPIPEDIRAEVAALPRPR